MIGTGCWNSHNGECVNYVFAVYVVVRIYHYRHNTEHCEHQRQCVRVQIGKEYDLVCRTYAINVSAIKQRHQYQSNAINTLRNLLADFQLHSNQIAQATDHIDRLGHSWTFNYRLVHVREQTDEQVNDGRHVQSNHG